MLYDKKWDAKVPVEAPALEPWREVLLDAAEIIRERGWCQHKSENRQGQVCILGAIGHTYRDRATRFEAQTRFESFIGKHEKAARS